MGTGDTVEGALAVREGQMSGVACRLDETAEATAYYVISEPGRGTGIYARIPATVVGPPD